MSAASPGVTALFFGNEHYDRHQDYVFAIAKGLRHEYEAIEKAGIILQVDCPDLAMGRHTQFRELDLKGFREAMELNIAALNHATANIAPEQLRMHMCWGQYPGPHHHDVPFQDIIDLVWTARPHAIQFEAANPRHAHEYAIFESIQLPEGKVLIPGVIECQSNYIEHPELIAQRIGRYADLVGRDSVMAGCDCGFSIRAGSGGVDPEWCGQSLPSWLRGRRSRPANTALRCEARCRKSGYMMRQEYPADHSSDDDVFFRPTQSEVTFPLLGDQAIKTVKSGCATLTKSPLQPAAWVNVMFWLAAIKHV
jgi:5-methyltetrahydropteroyltriglutamate--homocysteine methyltransferase